MMNRLLKTTAFAALLVAAAPAPNPNATAVDLTLKQAFAGYFKESGPSGGDWDQPVFSAQTTKLIKAWKKHNGGELTGLSSYGWLCECQDWQHDKFAWRRTGIRQLQKDVLVVTVKVNAGFGDWGTQQLTMVKEGPRWVIDDLSNESAPFGVKAGMREELSQKPGD